LKAILARYREEVRRCNRSGRPVRVCWRRKRKKEEDKS
jgi:Lon protease-like protein